MQYLETNIYFKYGLFVMFDIHTNLTCQCDTSIVTLTIIEYDNMIDRVYSHEKFRQIA